MNKKILGLLAFVATGGGLLLSAMIKEQNLFSTEILVFIIFFFMISLFDHIYELVVGDDTDEG